MLNQIFIYFIHAIIIGLMSIGIGYSLFRLFKISVTEKTYTSVFLHFISGLYFMACATAAFFTFFKSILMLSLPLIGILFYHSYKTEKKTEIQWKYNSLNLIVGIILVFLFSFTFKYLPYCDFSNDVLNSPILDNTIYSFMSNAMVNAGHENTYASANFLYPHESGVSPYHYTELWLCVTFVKLFQLPSYQSSLLFIVHPLFMFGWLLAIASFFEIYTMISLKKLSYISILLLVSGIYMYFYDDIPFLRHTKIFCLNIITGLGDKYGFVYCLIAASIIIWHYWGLYGAIVIWLIIPMNFVASLPGIYGAVPLFIWLFRNQIPGYKSLFYYWALALVSYLVFYLVFGRNSGQSNDLNIDYFHTIYKFSSLSNFRIFVNIVLGTLIYLSVIYSLWFILLGLINLRELKMEIRGPLGVFILLTIGIGLLTWAIMFEVIDMVQMVNGCGILFLNTYLIFVLIRFWNVNWQVLNALKKFLVVVLASWIIILQLLNPAIREVWNTKSDYSKDYKNQVNKALSTANPDRIHFIANQSIHLDHIFDFLSYQRLSSNFIYFEHKDFFPICLDDYTQPVPDAKDYQKSIIDKIKKASSLYQFVEKQKKANKFLSLDKSRVDFMDSLKINYWTLSEGSIPSEEMLEKFKLVTEDPNSKERFYIRKSLF